MSSLQSSERCQQSGHNVINEPYKSIGTPVLYVSVNVLLQKQIIISFHNSLIESQLCAF